MQIWSNVFFFQDVKQTPRKEFGLQVTLLKMANPKTPAGSSPLTIREIGQWCASLLRLQNQAHISHPQVLRDEAQNMVARKSEARARVLTEI